ncbi:MAG TPA: hypothetical protein VMZ71_00315, partial [Gemmataceae bacterium]|nr:hypothetical protein [Gemmataceae bacterium]
YVRGLKPPRGAMSYTARTDRGWETFDYDYTEPAAGAPKPLALLNHLGGDPLLAAVWRSNTTADDYRGFVKWAKVFGGHAEKVILAKGPDEVKEGWQKFRTDFVPLLGELSDVVEKLWIPALDGEEGIVLDAKWASKRWAAQFEETAVPLPLPEFGVVLGVADAGKLKQALEGYRTVVNKVIAKVSELSMGAVPEVQIPKPQIEAEAGRETAYYPIPADAGLDPRVRPTGGLTPKVAALTLSKEHTIRLLDDRPLRVDAAPLKDLKRPLDSVFYFHWAGMVETGGVWAEYFIRQRAGADAGDAKTELATARSVIQFLQVFRSYTSATYREGKATVTHSEAIFRDVPGDGKR